jgi:UDP-glucose 4-epimerase
MKKCLITGGAGFIGSHLVEECLLKGWTVIVLDNLSTGKKENLSADNPNLEFIQGDITDKALLAKIRDTHPDIDYIFHLAAMVSVPKSMEDPVAAHTINFDGTLMILETFRKTSVKKCVYASSCAVYGNTNELPVNESTPPSPLSPYGADKLMAEHYMKIYNDSFNFPTVSCRFFNVFGERQDPSSHYSGVISIFFDRSHVKKRGGEASLFIYGDGKQTRDFIYVKDVVGALLFLAENSTIRGDVFNVGYGLETTILALAEKIKAIVDADIKTDFREKREGEIRRSRADISKIRATGFAFMHSLEEGLQRLSEFLCST